MQSSLLKGLEFKHLDIQYPTNELQACTQILDIFQHLFDGGPRPDQHIPGVVVLTKGKAAWIADR